MGIFNPSETRTSTASVFSSVSISLGNLPTNGWIQSPLFGNHVIEYVVYFLTAESGSESWHANRRDAEIDVVTHRVPLASELPNLLYQGLGLAAF